MKYYDNFSGLEMDLPLHIYMGKTHRQRIKCMKEQGFSKDMIANYKAIHKAIISQIGEKSRKAKYA